MVKIEVSVCECVRDVCTRISNSRARNPHFVLRKNFLVFWPPIRHGIKFADVRVRSDLALFRTEGLDNSHWEPGRIISSLDASDRTTI